MRSRDGNSYLLLRLCSIIICASLALTADEYLISYRSLTKNALLHNETLLVSKAMKKCQGSPYGDEMLLSGNRNVHDLKTLISQNIDGFRELMQKVGLHVEHDSKNLDLTNDSTTKLTMRTVCFKVDFNDNSAIIVPLK